MQKEGFHSRIIINTAYSYFEYAKKAVSLGAVDYLVKPMDHDTFSQTIEKAVKELEQERLRNRQGDIDKRAFQRMLEVAGKAVISSVILGKPNAEELTIWLENMGHTYWGGFFVAGKTGQGADGAGHMPADAERNAERKRNKDDDKEERLRRIRDLSERMLKRKAHV